MQNFSVVMLSSSSFLAVTMTSLLFIHFLVIILAALSPNSKKHTVLTVESVQALRFFKWNVVILSVSALVCLCFVYPHQDIFEDFYFLVVVRKIV